jgi:fumarate reductase subunit D
MSQVEDAIAVREATDWNARENEHLKTIDKELKWYRGHAKWNRIAHRIASIVVLFCSIVAPITVAGDDKTSILIFGYHIDKAQLSSIALIVTLILALTEGLRRLFHFEQQWATSNRVERALQDARSDFLDQRVLYSVGTEKWIEEYSKSRKSVAALINSDSEEFFEAILSEGRAAPASNK